MPLTDSRGVLGEPFPMTHEMKRCSERYKPKKRRQCFRAWITTCYQQATQFQYLLSNLLSLFDIIICFLCANKYDSFQFQMVEQFAWRISHSRLACTEYCNCTGGVFPDKAFKYQESLCKGKLRHRGKVGDICSLWIFLAVPQANTVCSQWALRVLLLMFACFGFKKNK